MEFLTIDGEHAVGLEVLGGEKVFLVDLARLVQGKLLKEFLSLEHQGERVSAVVRRVHFSDVDGVIGEIVVNDIRILGLDVELQDFAVVLQKLFLRLHAAASQLVFQVVHHLGVLHGDIFILKIVVEVVHRARFTGLLRHAQIVIKFSRVLIAVVEVDFLGVDIHLLSDHEIIHGEEFFIPRAKDFLTFQKGPLRNSRIFLFIFNDFNAVIFKIEVQGQLADAVLFLVRFNRRFFVESLESEHMFI